MLNRGYGGCGCACDTIDHNSYVENDGHWHDCCVSRLLKFRLLLLNLFFLFHWHWHRLLLKFRLAAQLVLVSLALTQAAAQFVPLALTQAAEVQAAALVSLQNSASSFQRQWCLQAGVLAAELVSLGTWWADPCIRSTFTSLGHHRSWIGHPCSNISTFWLKFGSNISVNVWIGHQ